MPVFINRNEEIHFLSNWLEREPNSLLFVYGPKSCGKTTLISKFIKQHLDHRKFAINYLNLRQVLVYNFQSFLDSFFVKTTKDKVKEIVAGITMNIGFFKLNVDDEAIMKKNPFKVMQEQLIKAQKKGIQPVIIIDEIQTLKNIYFNGEQNLLDKLFNLFVSLTKEIHVAHVILLTSDSYFIEDIYKNAKLKKSTELFHVGHLPKADVKEWLLKENFDEKDFQYMWEKLGGSAWEITQVLSKYKAGESIENACEYFINDEYSKLFDFIPTALTKEEEAVVQKVHIDIVKKGYAYSGDYYRKLQTIVPKMVEQDIWFYRTDKQQITPNSASIRWAMKRLLESQSQN